MPAGQLLLEVGPGLAFRFEGVADGLTSRAASFLAHYVVDELTREGPMRPLVVSSGPPPATGPAAARVRLEEEGLEVLEGAGVTVFRMPGIVGWCQPAHRCGGVRVQTRSPDALDRFVGLALVALLMEMAEAEGWLGVHAAAVAIEGRGVLLPGPSGAGKSTIFRSCHRAGLDVLSDDLVWLREEPASERRFAIHAFPRRQPGEEVPAPTVDTARLAAIVCPRIAARQSSSLTPLASGETLEALLEQSGLLGSEEATRRRFSSLVRLAGAVRGYRLLAGADRESVPAMLAGLIRPG